MVRRLSRSTYAVWMMSIRICCRRRSSMAAIFNPFNMKRYFIPILGILSVSLLAAFWYVEKRGGDEAAGTEPSVERRAACEQFLTVAIFQSGEAADEFLETCLRGDPV